MRAQISAILNLESGATRSPKELRTARSRQLHFLWFLGQKRILSQFVPVTIASVECQTYTMATYATHLGTGGSLNCQQLKSSTISKYLLDIAKLIKCLHPEGRDPRKKDNAQTELAPPIRAVLKELERYEKVPNRREPYTLAMHAKFAASESPETHDSCLHKALLPWFAVATHAGLRRSEWCQPKHQRNPSTPELNIFHEPKAFLPRDIEFTTIGKVPIPHDEALRNPSTVFCVYVRWRTQKNGQHGQRILFARNNDKPLLCPVSNWLTIVRRHKNLVKGAPNIPLAIYRTHQETVHTISKDLVDTQLKQLAKTTHNVTDKRTLAKFSSHSFRVGACVILQSQGFTPDQIKLLLRWESDSYRVYLRNLLALSLHQNRAINDASAMPSY